MKKISILFVCLLGLSSVPSYAFEYITQQAKVVEIIDGDGFHFSLPSDGSMDAGTSYRATLMAVDAPEVKRSECFAQESKDFLSERILGKMVTIEWDSGDKVTTHGGFALVYVSIDGVDINAEMIRGGYGWVPRRFSADRKEAYLELQKEAQQTRQGAWDACVPK